MRTIDSQLCLCIERAHHTKKNARRPVERGVRTPHFLPVISSLSFSPYPFFSFSHTLYLLYTCILKSCILLNRMRHRSSQSSVWWKHYREHIGRSPMSTNSVDIEYKCILRARAPGGRFWPYFLDMRVLKLTPSIRYRGHL